VNRLEATITLEYADEKTAEAIANAVSPDNYKTPAGLTIKTTRKENAVVTEINAETKISTFMATIDDLLSSASTAEKTLKIAQQG
jgi:tRNA threonylcarbamoyladenosine modification (KEOPS) complex  Pcc1 subunit